MEAQHIAQVKPLQASSHLSFYNSPVIDATVPNLSPQSSPHMMNGPSTVSHDVDSLNVLTSLQASSTNSTMISQPTAHLLPVTVLSNTKLNQTHDPSVSQKPDSTSVFMPQVRQVFNVTILSSSLAQRHSQALGAHVNETETISTQQSLNLAEDSHSRTSGSSCTTAKAVNDSQDNGTFETISDDNKNDLSNSYATAGDGYRCLVCNRKFTQRGNLKTHARTHSGPSERPYDCKTCGKRFTQKGNRDIHLKIHSGTKDHTCPHCDRGFTQRGNLKTHIRSVHTGEKPFSCDVCGKKFSQKANMLTHFRTHDKSARFSCNLCNKTFSQKGNLKTHLHRHIQDHSPKKT